MNNGIVNRLFLAALLFVCTDLCGQNVQIKTNLLYDATATINIGSECRLGRRKAATGSAPPSRGIMSVCTSTAAR